MGLNEKALREAKGELVFPKADGSMVQEAPARPDAASRHRPRRLIEGFEHRFRAPHCGWRERRPDSKIADVCSKRGKPSLWAKPIPRHVRFHSGGTAMVKKAGLAEA